MAAYLGQFRTIAGIKGKKSTGTPTFKDLVSGMVIRKSNIPKVDTEIINADKNLIINESKNSLNIKCHRPPFTPLHIYKSLVKIGLCLINNNQVVEYKEAIRVIKSVLSN